MNVVFMGTPDFCIPSLEELKRNYNISAIVTQPDRPAGRGHKVYESPVKRFAKKHGIKVYQPEKVKKNDEFYEELKKLNPDVIVVIAYGMILPKRILDLPKYGCVNIHASLLPKLRGAAPIQYAILEGYDETGVTSMLMNEKMDEGDILIQLKTPLHFDDTAKTLHDRLAELSVRCLSETLEGLKNESITPKPQNHDEATYTKLIKKEDGKINWDAPALKVYNHVRAMNSWPLAFSHINGNYMRIWETYIVDENYNEKSPGEIVEITKHDVKVSCNPGLIALKKVQISGKKPMNIKDFLNGHSFFKEGDKFDF